MPWHNVVDAAGPELDELAKRYNLHELHVADCRSPDQRVKIEEVPDYLFLVLKPIYFNENGDSIFSSVYLFVGQDYCITVNGNSCLPAQKAIENARNFADPERPDQVLYRIFDMIVDEYLPAADYADERIDGLEDAILDHPTPQSLVEIFSLKRLLIDLRRVLTNTRDVGMYLQRYNGPLIPDSMTPFFRDIYDHLIRNLDTVETQRDLLNGTLDVYLSSISNRTNQVMKVLTVLSTVALPAVVVTSFYGMNVKGLPFADHPHSVWLAAVLIVVSTVILLWMLRRFRWF